MRFHSRLSNVSPASGFTQSEIKTGAPNGTGAGNGMLAGFARATRGVVLK